LAVALDASFKVDDSKFQAALHATLKETKRTIADALNERMYYLMLRLFILLPPHSPAQQRAKIKAYINEVVGTVMVSKKTGKKLGKSRQLRRVHLMAQARQKANPDADLASKTGKFGLYGDTMKTAAAKIRRRAIGSVGYLKSAVVKALRAAKGRFVQFGGKYKYNGRGTVEIKGNYALIALANQYGLPEENVAIHKGSNATFHSADKGIGLSPQARMQIVIGLADGQQSRVQAIYNPSMQRALDDERKEMLAHIGGILVGIVDEECGTRGFKVVKRL
jgi:hypothetical protein